MTSCIAFALDFASLEEARQAAVEVAPAIGMVKVGLELFVHAGPAAVALGREVDLPVFLDLKLHDIPETVERAVAQASRLGARLVTVHASGGRAMLKRAVDRAAKEGGTLAICAVTILTSARSFLHSQVRSMVGSLVWVGEGRWSADDLAAALAARNRAACGPVAPPEGLYLVRVDY